jgi:uncharacterized damage-inducible protein DinB
MDPRVAPFARLYDLNTSLLLNCVDGLTDEEGRRRLSDTGNNVSFLAAHLADSRHFLVERLGRPLDNMLARYLEGARRLEDIREWPSLAQVIGAWRTMAPHLRSVLEWASEPALGVAGAHRFPIDDSTPLGLIAFLCQHESYHIGQLAFLRRQLGHSAMSYARREAGAESP